MLKKITFGKLEISYDLEDVINAVSKWKYEKDSYNGKGEVDHT